MKKRLRLRVLRAAHEPKLSQSQLARKAGMGTFRYWQIENGEGPTVTADEKRAIVAALDARVSDVEWSDVAVAVERERAS
jgi:DNA-binding Xre family transcriptional regulator